MNGTAYCPNGQRQEVKRSRLCTRMRHVINAVRAEESIVNQIEENDMAELVTGMKGVKVGEMMDLIRVLNIMRKKSDGATREGYSADDYDKLTCDVNALSDLIEMGLPADEATFSYRVDKGSKKIRNKNSKIASFLQHLSLKNPQLKLKLETKLDKAFETALLTDPKRKAEIRGYRAGMIFDQDRVEKDDETSVEVSTGMANVDWLLLAAYHIKKLGLNLKSALGLLKGVAAYSMRFALTKERIKGLRKVWVPMEQISSRFTESSTKHMCPLELTASRLVNCSSLLFKGASDIYVLRMNLNLGRIASYISAQLKALGGISMISREPEDTSSVEWLLHRLLLSGVGGDSAKYIEAAFNPVKAFTNDYLEESDSE